MCTEAESTSSHFVILEVLHLRVAATNLDTRTLLVNTRLKRAVMYSQISLMTAGIPRLPQSAEADSGTRFHC